MSHRVLIDARMVIQKPHGVARYVSLLAQGLRELKNEGRLPYECFFLLSADRQEKFKEGFFGFEAITCKNPYLSLQECLELPGILKKARADLYHSPSLSSLFYCPCPWISTVHDLNHLTYGGFKERIYYQFVLRPFYRKARVRLTVSEFSRLELSKWSGCEDIEIVYNALDPRFLAPPGIRKDILDRIGLRAKQYFLCLSNPKPHKNINLLIEAYRKAAIEYPLVLSLPHQRSVIYEKGILFIGSLDDEETAVLLAGARVLCFPSLYEGFGLPPVEAASLGVGLVVSDIPAHREALQDLRPEEVHWVNPTDLAGWVGALQHAQKGAIQNVSAESREKLKNRYSVQALANHMDRIYRNVLEYQES